MKNQVALYLDDNDREKLDRVKERYGINSTSEMVRRLIENEDLHLRLIKKRA